MSFGRAIFFVFVAIIVIVGVSIAFSRSSDGTGTFGIDKGSVFYRSLFWYRKDKPTSTASSSDADKPKEAPKKTSTQESKEKPKPPAPSGFEASQLSPYWQEVEITKVTPANISNYDKLNGFTLEAQKENGEAISITGWKIRGNRGGEMYVPKGVADLGVSAYGVPADISLAPGEYAVFYSTQSAMNRNFRLNKCTGYLGNTYSFNPALPKKCPTPYAKSELAALRGECQDFIRSIKTCGMVKANDVNRFSGSGDAQCRAILDRFNYGVCYQSHRADADFFAKEWRVWLGIPMPFDARHDRVLLFDSRGLLVDEYIY